MTHRVEARTECAPVAVVERLVAFACLAPSVHNTQPWRWRYADGRLELRADLDRHLITEDPLGRDLTLSCGAALHHVQFAARALGWQTAVERVPLGSSDVLARIEVFRTAVAGVVREDLDLLRQRCTDRRRFTAWPVPADHLERLCRSATAWGAEAEAITGDAARFRLEVLTHRALGVLAADPARIREQERWIDRGATEGIPRELLPDLPAPLRSDTRFPPGLLEDTRMIIHGGDRVIALGGSQDHVGAWLTSGEALSALWLEATRAGISVVPMSQPTEVEAVRQEIGRSVLAGRFETHLLVRVGWQAIGRRGLPRTPRRPLREVLDLD
ncbi:Acg family FMN-binding oxidoreductase [Nocardioides ultimimeridianus]